MKIKTLTNKQIKDAPYAGATTIDCIKENTTVAVNSKKVIKDSRDIKWYELSRDRYISERFCQIVEETEETEEKGTEEEQEEKTNSEK